MNGEKSIIVTIIDGVFLLRPVVLIPVWGFALFGFFKGSGGTIAELPDLWRSADPLMLVWIIVFSLSVGAVYVLNQIADIEVDTKNGGLPLLAAGIATLPVARIAAAVAAIVSIAAPALAGHATIAILSALSIALGAIYSFRPVYLSGRPFFDFLSNAFGFGVIAFGIGWYLAGKPVLDGAIVPAALPYFTLMCAGAISSTIPDITGDKKCGKRTTAVVFGEKRAQYIATGSILLASIYSLVVRDPVAAFCAIASIPWYVLYQIKPKRVFAESTYKVGGALCMAAAACIMPLFALCAGAVFLTTWMYFRLRHGVLYPSFVPVDSRTIHSRGNS